MDYFSPIYSYRLDFQDFLDKYLTTQSRLNLALTSKMIYQIYRDKDRLPILSAFECRQCQIPIYDFTEGAIALFKTSFTTYKEHLETLNDYLYHHFTHLIPTTVNVGIYDVIILCSDCRKVFRTQKCPNHQFPHRASLECPNYHHRLDLEYHNMVLRGQAPQDHTILEDIPNRGYVFRQMAEYVMYTPPRNANLEYPIRNWDRQPEPIKLRAWMIFQLYTYYLLDPLCRQTQLSARRLSSEQFPLKLAQGIIQDCDFSIEHIQKIMVSPFHRLSNRC